MPDSFTTIHGVSTMVCEPGGAELRTASDVTDLMASSYGHEVDLYVVPVERLAGDFFQLRTGVAGEIMQKFVQYGCRLVVLGDISAYVAQSTAWKGLVYESNRGNQVWFLTGLEELDERLAAIQR